MAKLSERAKEARRQYYRQIQRNRNQYEKSQQDAQARFFERLADQYGIPKDDSQ